MASATGGLEDQQIKNLRMGMDITIVTTAKNNDDSYELLEEFGMPFEGKK